MDAAPPALYEVHVEECLGEGLVADSRHPLPHQFECLVQRQLARAEDLQAVVEDGDLDVPPCEIAAVQRAVDEQFPNGHGRNFVDILTIEAVDARAKPDVPKDELQGLFLLVLDGAVEFAPVKENSLLRPLEKCALNHGRQPPMPRQQGEGVGGNHLAVLLRQDAPGEQLRGRDVLDPALVGVLQAVGARGLLQGTAKPGDVPVVSLKVNADRLVEETSGALEHQFPDHIFGGLAGLG